MNPHITASELGGTVTRNSPKLLEFYTFGERVDEDPLDLDVYHNIHSEGATIFDTTGKNKRIRERIQVEIERCLETGADVVKVGVQCQQGLHRSVEMTVDMMSYFQHCGVLCVHYDANP